MKNRIGSIPPRSCGPSQCFSGSRQRLAVDDGDHALDAGRDAAREVALAKARRDGLVDDAVRDEVRERALEPAADLDAKRAVLHRDEEQRAVVRLLAAELPGIDHADRVLLDRLGLRGRDDQHRDLRAFPRLERRELLLEGRAFRRRQRAGEVRDARLRAAARAAATAPSPPSGRRRKSHAAATAATRSRTRGRSPLPFRQCIR